MQTREGSDRPKVTVRLRRAQGADLAADAPTTHWGRKGWGVL